LYITVNNIDDVNIIAVVLNIIAAVVNIIVRRFPFDVVNIIIRRFSFVAFVNIIANVHRCCQAILIRRCHCCKYYCSSFSVRHRCKYYCRRSPFTVRHLPFVAAARVSLLVAVNIIVAEHYSSLSLSILFVAVNIIIDGR